MNKVNGVLLVQQDLQELIKRLNARMEDALRMFAQKRTREHFEQIFFNRYKDFSHAIFSDLDSDVYPKIVSIYEEIDEMYWYLKSTEDMPSLVRTKVDAYLKNMNKNYAEVLDHLMSDDLGIENNIEIGHDDNSESETIEADDYLDSKSDGDYFETTGRDDTPPPFFEDDND